MNKFRNWLLFGDCKLVIDYYLEFEIWLLEFNL